MIQRFDPFSELLTGGLALGGRQPQVVPLDAYRSGDHVVLHVDLPGVDPGSIDVVVERGVLTVTAERTPRAEEGVQWLARERATGTVDKRIVLGDALDPDTLAATYDAGVLTMTVGLARRATARHVPVEVPGQAAAPTAGTAVLDQAPERETADAS